MDNQLNTESSQKPRRVYVDQNLCIGCKLCEIWCVVEHSESGDILKAFKKDGKRPFARIKVEENYPYTQAAPCHHCPEPDCMFSCIAGAISRDPETKAVVIDEEKCVGCWTCVLMCPHGAIVRSEQAGERHAVKCDMCGTRVMPSCVEHCPNDALRVGESEE